MTQESATSLSEAAAHVTAAPPPDLDPVTESHAPDDPAHSDVHGDMESPFTGPSKKKKKKQTTASRGPTALAKNRGTGFEEYYADPPMTPQEAAEETMEIYAGDLPFEERIQACIQRFRSRRRLQGKAILYFDEYLFLGGIDAQPGAFTGRDDRALEELTPAERREATATDLVHRGAAGVERFYNGDREHWSVDFAGVAAGFLSTALVYLTGLQETDLNVAVGVIENFLRYVAHHDVCTEYSDNINEALRLCKVAREEWPMVVELRASLPGQFNIASAELFIDSASSHWAFHGFTRPDDFDPEAVFYSAFALMNEQSLFTRLTSSGKPRVIREFPCTLVVLAITRPDDDILERFRRLELDEKSPSIAPIGKATFRPAIIEDDWEHSSLPSPFSTGDDEVTLFLDDEVLANMKPGIKMSVVLCELDIGLRFIKNIVKIVPSFYTFLPQEMMRQYKPPRESDRPAPSIHNIGDEGLHLEKEAGAS